MAGDYNADVRGLRCGVCRNQEASRRRRCGGGVCTVGRSRLARIRRAELRDNSIPEGSNRLHELPVCFQKGCTLEQEFLPQLRGEDEWRI